MLKIKYITFFFLRYLFLFSHFLFSQNDEQKDNFVIDSIILSKTTEFQEIYNAFRPYSKDSLKIVALLEKSKSKNYSYGACYALHLMGVYCRNTSNYQESINYHTEALKLARANGYSNLEITSLNMLGVVYRRIDAVSSALDYHQEALEIAENLAFKNENITKGIAVSLNSMGNIYLALEQWELAIDKFSKSLLIEKEVNNKLGIAINYHNIGYAKEGLGEFSEAMSFYQKSLDVNTQINSNVGKVICNSSIGTLLIKLDKDKEAIEILRSTLEDAKNLKDKFYLTNIYTSLGWAYLNTQNLKEAKFHLLKSQELAIDYNFKSSIEANYSYLATIAENESDYKNALFYAKESRRYADELNKEQNFQYINDLLIKYDTKKKEDQIKLLEKENEIVGLRFKQNKNILFASFILFSLGLIIIYILYRQHILKKEKKILTLEQDILRSQMNPHFIFNSLNSIKHFIINNEQKRAVYYLNKFAKLMRKILEASQAKEVSLNEELETITLYFNIENIRFLNEIELNTKIDETLNLNAIKVPSLFLQPFFENAIWHGLSSKTGAKKIDFEIKKSSNNSITISISDNGIGREKSASLNENKLINRKSVGLSLSKQRLANFVKDYKETYSLDFIDLKNSNGIAEGTKVILKIPLIE